MAFKDFTNLSQQLRLITEGIESRTLVQRINTRVANMREALIAVPANYTNKYNAVQMLQYDSNGNVQDVTPPESLSVPNSVLTNAQALLSSNRAILESDAALLDTIPVSGNITDFYLNRDSNNRITTLGMGHVITADNNGLNGKLYIPNVTMRISYTYLGDFPYALKYSNGFSTKFENDWSPSFFMLGDRKMWSVGYIDARFVYGDEYAYSLLLATDLKERKFYYFILTATAAQLEEKVFKLASKPWSIRALAYCEVQIGAVNDLTRLGQTITFYDNDEDDSIGQGTYYFGGTDASDSVSVQVGSVPLAATIDGSKLGSFLIKDIPFDQIAQALEP